MSIKNRKVTLELNEHDASKLLALVQREIRWGDRTWLSYWQRLAKNIEHDIENSGFDTGKEPKHLQNLAE